MLLRKKLLFVKNFAFDLCSLSAHCLALFKRPHVFVIPLNKSCIRKKMLVSCLAVHPKCLKLAVYSTKLQVFDFESNTKQEFECMEPCLIHWSDSLIVVTETSVLQLQDKLEHLFDVYPELGKVLRLSCNEEWFLLSSKTHHQLHSISRDASQLIEGECAYLMDQTLLLVSNNIFSIIPIEKGEVIHLHIGIHVDFIASIQDYAMLMNASGDALLVKIDGSHTCVQKTPPIIRICSINDAVYLLDNKGYVYKYWFGSIDSVKKIIHLESDVDVLLRQTDKTLIKSLVKKIIIEDHEKIAQICIFLSKQKMVEEVYSLTLPLAQNKDFFPIHFAAALLIEAPNLELLFSSELMCPFLVRYAVVLGYEDMFVFLKPELQALGSLYQKNDVAFASKIAKETNSSFLWEQIGKFFINSQ